MYGCDELEIILYLEYGELHVETKLLHYTYRFTQHKAPWIIFWLHSGYNQLAGCKNETWIHDASLKTRTEWRLKGMMVLQWHWKWQVAMKICFAFVVEGMSWTEMTTVQEEQLHSLWLVVKDKGYYWEGWDCVDDTVAAAAAEAGKNAVARSVHPNVIWWVGRAKIMDLEMTTIVSGVYGTQGNKHTQCSLWVTFSSGSQAISQPLHVVFIRSLHFWVLSMALVHQITSQVFMCLVDLLACQFVLL